MPKIKSRDIAIAVDMYGCPNRCRHCWLGSPSCGRITEEDVQWAAARFRAYVPTEGGDPFINKLQVLTWVWEPDFSDEYKQLYKLEDELSDDTPSRFELLSIWRLARDENYAQWAKEIGHDTCQITFFGMEETNDWFYRRKGAFQDGLKATERLLDIGIKPRWQLFLTKKIIPELDELLDLVDRLELRERVKSLGGEFDFFMHTPGPDGEARKIEYLRPALDDTKSIPEELIESSRKHFNVEDLWYTESELISQILTEKESFPYGYSYPEKLCFYVMRNWDVFSNMSTLEPWWNLGNLKTDSLQSIVDNFEHSRVFGLKTIFTVPVKKLAKRFGSRNSLHIYNSKEDLETLYIGRYCDHMYSAADKNLKSNGVIKVR